MKRSAAKFITIVYVVYLAALAASIILGLILTWREFDRERDREMVIVRSLFTALIFTFASALTIGATRSARGGAYDHVER